MTENTNENFNLKIPNWLNILIVIGIFATMLIGAAAFLQNIVRDNGVPRYEVFMPSGVALGMWIIIQFVVEISRDADLASVMLIVLLISGLILLGIGMYVKGESEKSAFFHIAGAVLGLALGIPFGEKLRNDAVRAKTRRIRKTTARGEKNEQITPMGK